MSKVANAFGVGVSGALEVLLQRNAFDAGEVVEGVVVLRVSKPVQCRELVLVVEGTERLKCEEAPPNTKENMKTSHDLSQSILDDKIVLSMKESFEPGEYDFSFCYRLREDLPASFVIKDRGANRMRKVNASIAYRLSVSLPLTTGFSADLSVVRPIKVFAQRLAHPVQPIEASACKKIKALGLLSKGECVISAAMDQDAIVAGETLLVETSIKNQTRSDMSSVTLTLFEVLSVHMPERNTYTGEKVVRQEKMSGIQAGEQLDQVLSLPLVAESNALPVLPSTTATFVSWKYLVAIRCGFNMASAVDVELPFAILPFDRPADTVGPTVVTTVELDDKAAAVKTVDC